jgi:hypothetical protein
VDLAEAAAAFRALADRVEGSLAVDCARAMADVALAQLRIVTPVASGDLRDSERVNAVTGNGTYAVATLGPHIVYDEFRNNGGTITRKKGRPAVLGNPDVGFFGKGNPAQVTQEGAHYMEKGEDAARGPCHEAAERVAAFIFTL